MLTTIILALASGIILGLALISLYRDSVNRRHAEQLWFHQDTIADFAQGEDVIRLDFVSDFSELAISEQGDHAIVSGPGGFSLRIEGDFIGLSADDFDL